MMPIVETLYFLSAVMLAVYGFAALFYTWRYGRGPTAMPIARATDVTPAVTVQLPVYNERHVVERLLRSVMALEWPADRLQVQVLDDSTDDTTARVAAVLAEYEPGAPAWEHIRRGNRAGYKAGALQHGLASATGEFVALFDADFVAPRDFLRRLIPVFDDPAVGCVQARWGHLNRRSSPLTAAQALGIDGHFLVEQSVRSRLGAFLNFNGSAGVWRRACMDAAGGWQGDTLTEDLDLSYRAQLAGWRIAYAGEVVARAELPLQVAALKRQQFRWAKGSIQTAIKLMAALWAAAIPAWRKALGTLHLTNYAVHPLMLVNLLLLWPMSRSHSGLLVAAPFLTLAAVGPPSVYWAVLAAQGAPWGARVRRLALLMSLGMGLSLNNTRAVAEAVVGVRSEFKRTPKFAATDQGGEDWRAGGYALPHDPFVWAELALSLYAAGALADCLARGVWWVAAWALLYVAGYGYVAGLGFVQTWQAARSRRPHVPQPPGAPVSLGSEP